MDNITHCLQVHMNVLLFVLIKCPNIAPTIDQREILLSLSILRSHEKYILANSQRKMTIFSIILIPDFRKKGTYFGKISLHSLNISPLHKVEFSPTDEIGSGYPCVFWYLKLYR